VSKRKLLLADDSVTIQKVVNLTFADEGIEVVTVGDGDAAWQKFTEDKPDLVMADVNMPGLNGYRICELIKQSEETKQIPVILLVGSFEPFDEEKARRVGADDFLTKPFQSIRQLINKVSDLLGGEETALTDSEETIDVTGESVAANSFDDTLEMESSVDESDSTENLEDSAHDEIIYTNQIGSLPTDEAQKFESKPVNDLSAEETYESSQNHESNFETLAEDSAEDGRVETDFQSDDEVEEPESKEINQPRNGNIYEFSGEIDFAEDDITIESEQSFAERNNVSQKYPTFGTTSDLDFDDFDLLELPQAKRKFTSEIVSPGNYEHSEETLYHSDVESNKTSFEQLGRNTDSAQFRSLSPELIEAIADKVVEKLSDKVIKKIVKEAVSQMVKKK